MTRLLINGIYLNVEITGSGSPLVLLHGFSNSVANWRSHIDVFSQHYKTIAIDLIGHGKSDSPSDPSRYRMDNCVADLREIFGQLALNHINLLGYSMGARVALHVAAAHPDYIDT